MKLNVAIAVGCISLLLRGSAWAEDLTIAGKVVDAAGKPAAGVELASFWMSQKGSMQAYQGTTSDPDGRFSLKVPYWEDRKSVV